METLLLNSIWMTYNLCLGLIAVIVGWLAIKKSYFWLRIIFSFVWLLFIPNTLYILTDLIHLFKQLNMVGDGVKSLLVLQYELLIVLAIMLFICGLYPFEEFLTKILPKRKYLILAILITINFVIGFGVVLGRVEQVNSWEVITYTNKVVEASIRVLTSFRSMMLAIFFGIMGNIIYFALKTRVLKYSYYIAKEVFKIRIK